MLLMPFSIIMEHNKANNNKLFAMGGGISIFFRCSFLGIIIVKNI